MKAHTPHTQYAHSEHLRALTSSPSFFLLYLNNETFVGDTGSVLEDEIRQLLRSSKEDGGQMRIIMATECDPDRGACAFDRFFAVTPRDLVTAGLYKPIAISLYPGPHAAISMAEILKSMGLQRQARRQTAVRISRSRRLLARSFRRPDAPALDHVQLSCKPHGAGQTTDGVDATPTPDT